MNPRCADEHGQSCAFVSYCFFLTFGRFSRTFGLSWRYNRPGISSSPAAIGYGLHPKNKMTTKTKSKRPSRARGDYLPVGARFKTATTTTPIEAGAERRTLLHAESFLGLLPIEMTLSQLLKWSRSGHAPAAHRFGTNKSKPMFLANEVIDWITDTYGAVLPIETIAATAAISRLKPCSLATTPHRSPKRKAKA
jgi:hypothetical protein